VGAKILNKSTGVGRSKSMVEILFSVLPVGVCLGRKSGFWAREKNE
jgi:hypothetical protein